jgi:outer membrane lipoprotein carrier protein
VDDVRLSIHKSACLFAGVLSFFLFCPCQKTVAGDITPRRIAENLQERYETAQSFSADFSQETLLQLGSGRKREGKGSVVIQKPGHMRWDYREPDPQIIICDGKSISIYLEKAKQLLVGDARDYLQSDVTYTFFTGTGDILKDFDVLPPDDGRIETGAGFVIKLIPKESHPHVDTLMVVVDKTSFLVKKLVINDRFGSITTMTFSNMRVNVPFPAGFFTFEPPPGTEIIRQ